VAFLLLTGCQGQTFTTAFDLTFKTDDEIQRSILLTSSERVIERMVMALEGSVPDMDIEHRDDTERITVTVENEESVALLAANLTRPIEFRVMLEAEEEEEPDLSNEQYGAFMYTGLTEEQIDWVKADEIVDKQGMLTITFDEEGKQLLNQLFTEKEGKRIGLFVRGGLVSMYVIQEEDDDRENIIITGIPSPDLAHVFADDVNVGSYVTFTHIP